MIELYSFVSLWISNFLILISREISRDWRRPRGGRWKESRWSWARSSARTQSQRWSSPTGTWSVSIDVHKKTKWKIPHQPDVPTNFTAITIHFTMFIVHFHYTLYTLYIICIIHCIHCTMATCIAPESITVSTALTTVPRIMSLTISVISLSWLRFKYYEQGLRITVNDWL